MNGMHYQWNWAYTADDDLYSLSYDFSTSPTPTVLELSLDNYFEFDDQAAVDLAFTHAEFLDENGVTRHREFPDPDSFDAVPAVSISGLTYVQWGAKIKSCAAEWTMNAYFWDSVY